MEHFRKALDVAVLVFLWAASCVVIGAGVRLMFELFCFGYRCTL